MAGRGWNGHEIPYEADLLTLARMLDGETPAPWLALTALAARDDDAALNLIIQQSRSVDPQRRRAAVEAISTSPIGTQALDIVRNALDDPSPMVVDVAIKAIGRLHDEPSRPRLRALLRDRNPSYRGNALIALRDMWSDADFRAVLEIAKADRDERNRKLASFLVRDHPVEWRPLVTLWRDSVLPRERVWACELIGEQGDATDINLLELLRKDSNGHVRQSAEEAFLSLDARARPAR